MRVGLLLPLPSITWIVAAALAGLVACGNDGSEREVVRLAVGVRFDSGGGPSQQEEASHGLILRNAGDAWVSVGDEVLDERGPSRVVFSSPDVAWAYGGRFLRSMDAGRTWRDVESNLPEEVRKGPHVLAGLVFASATTGYLGSFTVTPDGSSLDGPFVWVTRDGGEKWSRLENVVLGTAGNFALAVRDGVAEMVRHPPSGALGAIVEAIDGAPSTVQTLATSPVIIGGGFSTVGARGWMLLNVAPDGHVLDARPTILTSAHPGAPWTVQQVPDIRAADFGPLDMCDASVGVAGGSLVMGGFGPAFLWTDDGGGQWHASTVRGTFSFVGVPSVLCVHEREAWAVANDLRTFRDSALLKSVDGGRTFERVPGPFDGRSQIFDLARSSTRE